MVEFENGDALFVVDVLADFDHEDSESLLASFRERGAAMASAIAAARGAGVPVVYVNDDRGRWHSDSPALAREEWRGRAVTSFDRFCCGSAGSGSPPSVRRCQVAPERRGRSGAGGVGARPRRAAVAARG